MIQTEYFYNDTKNMSKPLVVRVSKYTRYFSVFRFTIIWNPQGYAGILYYFRIVPHEAATHPLPSNLVCVCIW